jgi:hypothetical protein
VAPEYNWSVPAVLRTRFHDLRHTHATHLLSSGVHPKVAQERLGHSSVGITLDFYSHVLPGMQDDAAGALCGSAGAYSRQSTAGMRRLSAPNTRWPTQRKSKKFLLGVDLGTSATKASLYDSTGNLLSEGCAEVPLSYPQPDAVDQDMQDFCQSAAVAVRQCMGAALKVVLQINAREEELRHRPDDPNDNGVKTPK